jgi:hypothetical protein
MSKANYDLHLGTDRLKTVHAGQDRNVVPMSTRHSISEDLSCGAEDAFPEKMGELVMENKERFYTYSKAITSYILVTDAFFGFKYLRSLNQ